MSSDQLNACIVIMRAINMATSKEVHSIYALMSENILIRLKVKVLPIKSVSRNLHFMAVLQTCATTYKEVMAPCMPQNLLVLQDKRKLNQYERYKSVVQSEQRFWII